jgi:hypothetical protein
MSEHLNQLLQFTNEGCKNLLVFNSDCAHSHFCLNYFHKFCASLTYFSYARKRNIV